MALGTHVQVWMFLERAWDKGYTGSVGLADGVGVGGVVKTCSDGALNDRNMRRVYGHKDACMFQLGALCHMHHKQILKC